jgi:hypothetical protein
MTTRLRLTLGLCGALLVGALGPTMYAVATHSGSGTSTISGTITSGGEKVDGLCAAAWFSRDNRATTEALFAGSVRANADGNYTLVRLPADTYKVEFYDCAAPRRGNLRAPLPTQRQSSFWPGEALYENAAPIVVGPADALTGIDGDISALL